MFIGGIVFEVIGYQFLRHDLAATGYRLEVAAEESFEMMGASVVLYAVLMIRARRAAELSGEGLSSPGA